MGFVDPANKKQEHTLPADYPMAIWSGFVDYSRIYSASCEGAWFEEVQRHYINIYQSNFLLCYIKFILL